MTTYQDIFGVPAPKPGTASLYRDVYRTMAGSPDARTALVEAGLLSPGAGLSELNQLGTRLFARLNEVERASDLADTERGLEAALADWEAAEQEHRGGNTTQVRPAPLTQGP